MIYKDYAERALINPQNIGKFPWLGFYESRS